MAKIKETQSAPPAATTAATAGPGIPLRAHLKRGAAGPAVAVAQAYLGAKGFAAGKVDGVFGAWLERALRHYQKFNGLVPTGELDRDTWNAIDSGK